MEVLKIHIASPWVILLSITELIPSYWHPSELSLENLGKSQRSEKSQGSYRKALGLLGELKEYINLGVGSNLESLVCFDAFLFSESEFFKGYEVLL